MGPSKRALKVILGIVATSIAFQLLGVPHLWAELVGYLTFGR